MQSLRSNRRRTVLLKDHEATRAAVLPLLPDRQLGFLHFNGHGGVGNAGSYLCLAQRDALSCRDLDVTWPNHPWVHLDCCHGGFDTYRGGGRLDSLTAKALDCGASAVLASSHTIGDADSARFAEVFYGQWLAGQCTAADALLQARRSIAQQAQYDLLMWAMPVLHGNARARWRNGGGSP